MDTLTTLRPRRPRPKVVTLTDRAAERVREIMGRADKA
jgi:iron-sulfur cluster assembly protein